MDRLPVTLCGSLSRYPVGLGAAMHEAGYRALGLGFAYVPFPCEDLAAALSGMRALGIRGLGISMPFKIEILPLLDAVDELAARIGAVNTVVNDSGRLTGYNTDAVGAVLAVEEVIPPRGVQVTVIGAGGAARAVAFGLASAGARVCVVNRTERSAHELARSISAALGADVSAGPLSDLAAFANAQVVVNATSATMADRGALSPVPAVALRRDQVVMDIVYKPIRTTLLAQAADRGARVIHGGRMLLHQACRQFELYTGRPAPRLALDAALSRFIAGDES